jgi:hypothetical protein
MGSTSAAHCLLARGATVLILHFWKNLTWIWRDAGSKHVYNKYRGDSRGPSRLKPGLGYK